MGCRATPITSRRRPQDGDGALRCMNAAIERAGISPAEIDYINAHGTSTPLGDEIELGAVHRLVGNAAGRMCMSSTKSSIGHLLGAAGAVEAIFSILAMRDGVAPPTINLDNPSVETPIDLVPHQPKSATSTWCCPIHSASAGPMPPWCFAAVRQLKSDQGGWQGTDSCTFSMRRPPIFAILFASNRGPLRRSDSACEVRRRLEKSI